MTGTTTTLPAIERTLELKADIHRVWRAITDPEELSRWFPDHATWDLRPGGEGVFTFEGYPKSAVRIEAVEAPSYLAWRWDVQNENDPTATETPTLVEWWLEERDGGGTTLRMRESGFRFESHREGNETGWTKELGELVAFLGE